MIWQYRWQTVRDLQIRTLNASLSTDLSVTSPLSRLVVQAVPPYQVKAYWSAPEWEPAHRCVLLSVELEGGVRHVVDGTNLTMSGRIRALCGIEVRHGDDGLAVVSLAEPGPAELDLGALEVVYEGDEQPASRRDRMLEELLLRPVFTSFLTTGLARLPLNYVPAMPGIAALCRRAGWSASADMQQETLTIAAGTAADEAPLLLPDNGSANLAVAISEKAIDRAAAREIFSSPGTFRIPGTDLCVQANLVELASRDGYLCGLYELPPPRERVEVTVEDPAPNPEIHQPLIPQQVAPGMPVTAQLVVTLPWAAHPPYDHVWRIGERSCAEPVHSSTVSVTAVPVQPPETADPATAATLTTVRLRVIDMLGRTGDADYEVAYYPHPRDEPSAERREPDRLEDESPKPRRPWRLKVVTTAGAFAALLIIAGNALRPAEPTELPPLAHPVTSSPPAPSPSASPSPSPAIESPSAAPGTAAASPTPTRRRTTSPSPPPPPPLTANTITSVGVCAPSATCDATPPCEGCSENYTGSCAGGYTLNFISKVSVNRGPTVVTFRWILNGSPLPNETINFSGTGAQSETVGQVTVLYSSSGPWTARLELISPIPKTSNTVTSTITCT